ncbi:hypothetical protein H5410_028540, partial [Solanum commersonii]
MAAKKRSSRISSSSSQLKPPIRSIQPFIARLSKISDESPSLAHHHLLHSPYVYQRGLVKVDSTYREVIDENLNVSENISQRHFGNPVLAYITPWNSKGYDVAKKFSSKITHLSPVWYELKKFYLELSWRRFLWTCLRRRSLEKAINLIIMECKEMEYDGIVLESWSRWVAYGIF